MSGDLKKKLQEFDLIEFYIPGMWKSDVFLLIYFGLGTNSL